MAFSSKLRTIFGYGFAKSERDNVGPEELEFWRRVASAFLAPNEAELAALADAKEVTEVICGD